MINGIIGRKIGMTQLFGADGTITPVTVIKAGPCVIVQKKSSAGPDGYDAVQLGLVEDKPVRLKNVSKPMRGHFEKTGGGTPRPGFLKNFVWTVATPTQMLVTRSWSTCLSTGMQLKSSAAPRDADLPVRSSVTILIAARNHTVR